MRTALKRIVFSIVPCLGLCLSQSAKADVVVTFQQVGSNVVATGSGSFDTAALINDTTLPNVTAFVQFTNPNIDIGSTETVLRYDNFTNFIPAGPTGFGFNTPPTTASSGTGDNFGFGEFVLIPSPHPGLIVVPTTYVSGSQLSGTATWDNTTLAALNLQPGSYKWTWGSAATADSFTLNIDSAAAPEPNMLGLLAIAAAVGLFANQQRKREAQPADRV
jgi:hypothetical protein